MMGPDYLHLEDAAAKAGCTPSALMQYGATGHLKLHVLLDNCKVTGTSWSEDPSVASEPTETGLYDESEYENYPLEKTLEWIYPLPVSVIKRIEAGAEGCLEFLIEKPDEPYVIHWLLQKPIPLRQLKIVVLPEDVEKFISENPASKPEKPSQTQPIKMKKAAIVAMLEDKGFEGVDVENAFRRAYKNGLSAAAKHENHGYWHVEKTITWFTQQCAKTNNKAPANFLSQGKVHKCK